jgi:lysophospholipase-3
LYWLHQQTADFKAKYIRSMINIAAPWGGAVKALRLMISGDNIDVRLERILLRLRYS